MRFEKEKKLIIKYSIEMLKKNLTKGSGGNISIFLREENLILITPSGVDYYQMQPEDIVTLDLNGKIVEGNRKPSSEYLMHKIFYENRKDINSIVHCHSIYSSTLACLHWEIPAAYYLIGVSGGENVRCAEYGTYGTKELAENVYKGMVDRYAVLLANHGLLTGAKDLPNAFSKAEEVELCAEIYYRAKSIGEPKIIKTSEVNKMLKKFESYGQVESPKI